MLPFIISELFTIYIQEGPIMTAELIKETEELVLRTGRYVKLFLSTAVLGMPIVKSTYSHQF